MVQLSALWLPIVLATVIVFVVSSLIHMLTPWHKKDYGTVPNQDQVLAALRALNLPPGDYMVPHPTSREEMKSPAFQEKMKQGPLAVVTIKAGGSISMGKSLTQWIIYMLIVSVFAGYVAGRALGPGADYLHVFRFAGVTAFLGYSAALAQGSIWFGRSWGYTVRSMIDGLLYGLLTAGCFGWLWPH